MRRLLLLMVVCACVAPAEFARAQQLDIAVGGSTLWSFKNTTASEGFLPPSERGGTYPSLSIQYTRENHLGIAAEGAFRYHQAIYDSFQPYRPVFYDINAVYAAPHVARKTTADFMAGIGGESLLFYNASAFCNLVNGGCLTHINSNHFMFHVGGGVRYYFFRNFFVRPEAHWYIIPNNFEFYSRNVFRVGASIGHTWK